MALLEKHGPDERVAECCVPENRVRLVVIDGHVDSAAHGPGRFVFVTPAAPR
jgi:hypothetical protein